MLTRYIVQVVDYIKCTTTASSPKAAALTIKKHYVASDSGKHTYNVYVAKKLVKTFTL